MKHFTQALGPVALGAALLASPSSLPAGKGNGQDLHQFSSPESCCGLPVEAEQHSTPPKVKLVPTLATKEFFLVQGAAVEGAPLYDFGGLTPTPMTWGQSAWASDPDGNWRAFGSFGDIFFTDWGNGERSYRLQYVGPGSEGAEPRVYQFPDNTLLSGQGAIGHPAKAFALGMAPDGWVENGVVSFDDQIKGREWGIVPAPKAKGRVDVAGRVSRPLDTLEGDVLLERRATAGAKEERMVFTSRLALSAEGLILGWGTEQVGPSGSTSTVIFRYSDHQIVEGVQVPGAYSTQIWQVASGGVVIADGQLEEHDLEYTLTVGPQARVLELVYLDDADNPLLVDGNGQPLQQIRFIDGATNTEGHRAPWTAAEYFPPAE